MVDAHPIRSARPVVLFYTDNGIGLGHLTRQLAIALRARGAFQPVFLTMSAGFSLPRSFGIPTEYFPSYGRLGISKDEWEPLILERLQEMIDATDARAVVVDHVSPPRIFSSLRERVPRTRLIWSRRGLWQPETNRAALALSSGFDLVIEPGDIAAVIDQGPTAEQRGHTITTGPVVLVRRSEYLPRDPARDALGIPRDGKAVLVNVGDRSADEVRRMIVRAAEVVRHHAGGETSVFAPLHPLHGDDIATIPGVLMAPVYPVARYFNAFDAVISSSGYNSFHEVVDSGLPAVFVPHQGARIDDQVRRARFAALCGRSQWAANLFGLEFGVAVERMLRSHEPAIADATTSILGPMTGADEVAELLARLVAVRRSSSPASARPAGSAEQMASMRDQLMVALDFDDKQVRELAATMSREEIARTIVVVGNADTSPLHTQDVVFESVMSADEWRLVGRRHDYADYLASRLARIERRYGITRTMTKPLDTKVTPR